MEIDDMQDQINKEAGIDPEDGGIDVPDNTDGITRYPQVDGTPIPPDDIDDTDSDNDEEGVDDMESDKDFMLKNSKKRKKKWVLKNL